MTVIDAPVHTDPPLPVEAAGAPTRTAPPEVGTTPRFAALGRRLSLALFDLGLDQALAGWVIPTDQGLAFAELPVAKADRLVCLLEDLALGRGRSGGSPAPGQLSFQFPARAGRRGPTTSR